MASRICGQIPTLELELSLREQGAHLIAGVDEVGRGSLAGPVVAAAVILPLDDAAALAKLVEVRDSKQLGASQRAALFATIREVALATAVGSASHHIIDQEGIGPANRRALARAVARLPLPPDALLLDYFRLESCSLLQLAVPQGDARSLSIAAASIVAKVVRDRWMTRSEALFPGYGFAQHKGYGTPAHRAALRHRGPCLLHRRSFAPVAETL